MLVQVAGSGNVMGSFIAPSWGQPQRSWIAEPTERSFTFSLVNAHSRPVKLKLAAPTYAAYHNDTDAVYLCHTSIVLMQSQQAANTSINTTTGATAGYVVLDDEYERKRGVGESEVAVDGVFMSGTPEGKFACAEIEVFGMQPQQDLVV